VLLVGVDSLWKFGNGVEFSRHRAGFRLVQVRARGNLSIQEKDNSSRGRATILGMPGNRNRLRARRAKASAASDGSDRGHCRHVHVRACRLEERAQASVILDETAPDEGHPGRSSSSDEAAGGPPTGKPIHLEISSVKPDCSIRRRSKIADIVRKNPDSRDVDDGLPSGIEL